MRTIEEIKNEICKTEKDLYNLKEAFPDNALLGADKVAYQEVQEKIAFLQNEINDDIIYIKTVYNQLLAIRLSTELYKCQNSDRYNVETSAKIHQAFILLIEYNKLLDSKIAERKNLLAERERIVQKSSDKSLLSVYRRNVSKSQNRLETLRKALRDTENQHSVSDEAKNRVIKELQEYQDQIRLDDTFAKSYEELKKLKNAKKQIPHPTISLKAEEKEALRHTSLEFDEYPNICETSYNNYLFQSLSVPHGMIFKEHFDELLNYSRFRIFTKLPQLHSVDDKIRTVYSLVLRMMNRGVVLSTNEKTEAKIFHYFGNSEARSFLSSLNNYVTYCSPHNEYDSFREKEFAEYYFPKVLGKSWATYVYTQMPISLLVPKNGNCQFVNERVDFLVCSGNRNIVIELDGEEHQQKLEADAIRDNALRRNGYIVKRISNVDVDTRSEALLQELTDEITLSNRSALSAYDKKHIVACKVVHQVAIAIVKMLEEGHISSRCNLMLEIDSDLFSDSEQKLLLLFAVEEITELIKNFAKLYGVEIDLDFFDERAENYWIQIGDGDENRNSVVIRDIVLPLNYLCSIHPFELVLPEKDAITEDILEYFLQYVYGYAQFRPGQFVAIRRTLRREESIVLLPTGSGKSVIYQLSSMLLPGITVVISPLRALIEDQVTNLADRGINNVAAIFSADKKSKDEMEKKAQAIMRNHSAMMLYIAPERMQIHGFREYINMLSETNNFCLIAIDEAHCVSEWGHDFRAAYLQIGRSCRRVFRKKDFVPPIIALTGTASDNVLRDVKRDLEISNPDAIITPPTFDRAELHYSIILCDRRYKFEYIQKLLNSTIPEKLGHSFKEFSELCGNQTDSGIIFTTLAVKGDCYAAWTVFNRLNKEKNGLQVGTYFSKPPDFLEGETWKCIIKSYAQEFKENQRHLLVATKAFGMGIDKPNIRYVIHNSLPDSIEQYYQEVGRAGRDGADSECIMLFSNTDDERNETILNPNLEFDKFKEEANKKSSTDNQGDISSLLYFHNVNFKGTDFEKKILFAVLRCLRKRSDDFKKFNENDEAVIDGKKVCEYYINNNIKEAIIRLVECGIINGYKYVDSQGQYKVFFGSISRKDVLEKYPLFVNGRNRDTTKETDIDKGILIAVWACLKELSDDFKKFNENAVINEEDVRENYLKGKLKEIENDIAKAIIRLVTLGIIKDYEYDYLQREYKVFFGSISRKNVLEKYLIFVNGCSRGRADDEATHLERVQGNDLHFIKAVIERYVDLVYRTIEKGRRRALHSMFRLAKEAVQIRNPKEQDEYIRSEIQNYLVKDDTVDLVKSSNVYAGIYEILNAYPLYPNDVIVDSIEQENAKKANGYAARMLATDPYHPGLLYLHAITSVKSKDYHNADAVNDIVAAYKNSEKYSIPKDISLEFLAKTMNLMFNASCELFGLLWDNLDSLKEEDFAEHIATKVSELSVEDVSQDFKDYLMLHLVTQSLHKMIGDR